MPEPGNAPLAAQGMQRFLTFRAADRLYALGADLIAEVIRTPQAARVPQAPEALVGLANLRGNVLPLASLRGILGLPMSGESPLAIVLDGAQPVALEVDTVEALVAIASVRIETRQAELAARPGEILAGAFDIEGLGIARILDAKALLDKSFTQRAQRKPSSRQAGSAIARREQDDSSQSETFVTFDVAGQEYALALSAVREIVPAPAVTTSLPHAEALVVGMMAYRDRLLPLLSLRGLLGFPPGTDSDGREKVFVSSVGGAIVGLVADRARAIVSARRSDVDPVPAVLAARSGGESRIKAICRAEGGRRLISILSPEGLFRADIMQRLGSGQVASAAEEAQVVSDDVQFLVFRLGADEFALPIEAVDEVARVPDKITRVPKTPKFLDGVINLRGEVLPVVDQRRRFEMPRLEQTQGRRLVVVRTEGHRAGLIVDSVSEVLRSSEAAIEPPPDLTGEITRLVQGVINLDGQGRIILLLDPAELLTRSERTQLDAFESKAKAPS